MTWFRSFRDACLKFAFLTPLHALELTIGWFMVGTGVWICFPANDQLAHPLTDLLLLANIHSVLVGVILIVLGLFKSAFAFIDFQPSRPWVRRGRLLTATLSMAVWSLILVNGYVWHSSPMWLRYVVLMIADFWTLITGGRSRPGSWE